MTNHIISALSRLAPQKSTPVDWLILINNIRIFLNTPVAGWLGKALGQGALCVYLHPVNRAPATKVSGCNKILI